MIYFIGDGADWPEELPVTTLTHFIKPLRSLLLAGVAVVAISACASNRMPSPDYSGMAAGQSQQTLGELTARYKNNPKDKGVAIQYAAALRAVGQSQQAVAVLEISMSQYPRDADVNVAYAKALTAEGRFEQSLQVLDNVIRPEAPDWNALLVKGATLDQLGRNAEARVLYTQALVFAPGEASIEANMGLSYAMTSELPAAEQHLRRAVQMQGATSRIRQNLALVVGLQGRFDECRALYAAELPPEQVDSNMAYVRSLLTQQNRWDMIAKS
ncbi:Flp pilus assembly protein TadD, contains TPR repeats [Devosia psychrophila]|uniref:Flp pilus assembly protein TadD, contains TPR repeats n=1 Tax=Devosia psychrophila TaxID=728005 RepID=A0A1I1MGP6_9HYPH|nr:Flp pilus assembly protein TadD, contains TPR repeats [Devosia psychrophila]